jgi:long-subunit acyl-CoA synthetase (AMP-forming)
MKQVMDSACVHACGSHVSIKSALDLSQQVGRLEDEKQNADSVCALARCAGNPKGVVLTHKNVLATVAALQTFVREVGLDLGSDDSTLSYLTLAHILGRALEEFALSVGASIGYWQVRAPTVLLAFLATFRSNLVALIFMFADSRGRYSACLCFPRCRSLADLRH